jgi:hypothetical protein
MCYINKTKKGKRNQDMHDTKEMDKKEMHDTKKKTNQSLPGDAFDGAQKRGCWCQVDA